MMNNGPICSLCTRDWDERLGYCEYCEGTGEGEGGVTKKTKKAKAKKVKVSIVDVDMPPRPTTTETPLYEQLTIDFGFVPNQSPDWRNMPAGAGLLEDNFS